MQGFSSWLSQYVSPADANSFLLSPRYSCYVPRVRGLREDAFPTPEASKLYLRPVIQAQLALTLIHLHLPPFATRDDNKQTFDVR